MADALTEPERPASKNSGELTTVYKPDQTTRWTSHIAGKDVPFVETGEPGIEIRLLHYREEEQMMAVQLRAAPFSVSRPHVHLGPAHAYTVAGCWGHDHDYQYVEGTYIFEPIGVAHQFFSGAEAVDSIFLVYGESQWIDEKTGEVGGQMGVAHQVASYFQRCEESGLTRPNILRD